MAFRKARWVLAKLACRVLTFLASGVSGMAFRVEEFIICEDTHGWLEGELYRDS